jgi:DHA1 family tetracycline resistance protein-like MFS transporter
MENTFATAPAKPVSRHAVSFVLICVLLDMVGFGLIIPVLPALIRDVGHVDIANASIIGGWMFLAFSATAFLFSPLMGNLSDRFGRRPLLLLAILGLGLDYLLQAFAPTLAWLFVGRIIAGLCGSSWVIANAFLADVTPPEDRARVFGIMGAAFGAGFVVGPAIGGLLGTFGPRVPFFVAAGISGLNLIYGYVVLPESLPLDKRRSFEWARSNPFGAFRVFRRYKGVIPMCVVMFVFFFASSVYQAIWPFWGIAKFGWSEAMVGLSLAAFGVVMAAFQGLLTGPAVKYVGEFRVVIIGLVCSAIAALGYGLAGGMTAVLVLILVHGPEGFVHPMLTAMMSKAVPEDAQGELQGGIASLLSVAMLLGTLFFSQVFGYFMREGAPFQSPDVAYFIASAVVVAALAAFVWLVKPEGKKT